MINEREKHSSCIDGAAYGEPGWCPSKVKSRSGDPEYEKFYKDLKKHDILKYLARFGEDYIFGRHHARAYRKLLNRAEEPESWSSAPREEPRQYQPSAMPACAEQDLITIKDRTSTGKRYVDGACAQGIFKGPVPGYSRTKSTRYFNLDKAIGQIMWLYCTRGVRVIFGVAGEQHSNVAKAVAKVRQKYGISDIQYIEGRWKSFDKLASIINSNTPVYIHCTWGVHRSSTVLAGALMISQGMCFKEAIKCADLRFRNFPGRDRHKYVRTLKKLQKNLAANNPAHAKCRRLRETRLFNNVTKGANNDRILASTAARPGQAQKGAEKMKIKISKSKKIIEEKNSHLREALPLPYLAVGGIASAAGIARQREWDRKKKMKKITGRASFYDDPKGGSHNKYVKWLSDQTREINARYTKLSRLVATYERLSKEQGRNKFGDRMMKKRRNELLLVWGDTGRLLQQARKMKVSGATKYTKVLRQFHNGALKLIRSIDYMLKKAAPIPSLDKPWEWDEKTPPIQEQASKDWNALAKAYLRCRLKAAGGTAPGLHRRRVRRHIAQAKGQQNGWNNLIAHINKKYPGCLSDHGMNESMGGGGLYSELTAIAEQAHEIWGGEQNKETMDFAKSIAKSTIDLVDDKSALIDKLESVAKIVATRLCVEFDGGTKSQCWKKYIPHAGQE